MKNSICVYTCITGNYDRLRQPLALDDQIDFICFSDKPRQNSGVWQIRPIPEELKYLNAVKKQRVVKICPHRYLKEYSTSIWIDGNFQVVGSITAFIQQYDLGKTPLYVRLHPRRKCIYEEARVCIGLGKDRQCVIANQISRYKDEGYPQNIGMVETGLLLRRHNDKNCQILDNLWACELLNGSHRDQLSFNYACWKMHFLPGHLNNEFSINNSATFRMYQHG